MEMRSIRSIAAALALILPLGFQALANDAATTSGGGAGGPGADVGAKPHEGGGKSPETGATMAGKGKSAYHEAREACLKENSALKGKELRTCVTEKEKASGAGAAK